MVVMAAISSIKSVLGKKFLYLKEASRLINTRESTLNGVEENVMFFSLQLHSCILIIIQYNLTV